MPQSQSIAPVFSFSGQRPQTTLTTDTQTNPANYMSIEAFLISFGLEDEESDDDDVDIVKGKGKVKRNIDEHLSDNEDEVDEVSKLISFLEFIYVNLYHFFVNHV